MNLGSNPRLELIFKMTYQGSIYAAFAMAVLGSAIGLSISVASVEAFLAFSNAPPRRLCADVERAWCDESSA